MSAITHVCQQCGNPAFFDEAFNRWAHLTMKEHDLPFIHAVMPIKKDSVVTTTTQGVLNPLYSHTEPWDPEDKLRSKAERREGEGDKECVLRWISELSHAHPEWDHDQVVAVAHSKCGLSKT